MAHGAQGVGGRIQGVRQRARVPALFTVESAELSLGVAPTLADAWELTGIGTLGGEEYPAFTPGDGCPDNNLLTSE